MTDTDLYRDVSTDTLIDCINDRRDRAGTLQREAARYAETAERMEAEVERRRVAECSECQGAGIIQTDGGLARCPRCKGLLP